MTWLESFARARDSYTLHLSHKATTGYVLCSCPKQEPGTGSERVNQLCRVYYILDRTGHNLFVRTELGSTSIFLPLFWFD